VGRADLLGRRLRRGTSVIAAVHLERKGKGHQNANIAQFDAARQGGGGGGVVKENGKGGYQGRKT
jgi:hypothetical protein